MAADLELVAINDLIAEIARRSVGSVVIMTVEPKIGHESHPATYAYSGGYMVALGMLAYVEHDMLTSPNCRADDEDEDD